VIQTYLQRLRGLQRNARLFLLSNIMINIATGAIALLYTIFLTRLGYKTDFLSVLLVVGIIGAGVGLIPALLIVSRYSARQLLIGSNLIGGVAAAAQLVFPQAPLLIITTFFVGASASIYIVLTPPLLTATSTELERAHLFSINATLGLLTGVVGALVGGFLPNLMGNPLILHSPLIRFFAPILVHGKVLPLQLALLVAGALAVPSLWPLWRMDDAVVRLNEPRVAGEPPFNLRLWLRANLRRATVQRILHWTALRFAAYQTVLGLGVGLFLTYINLYFVNHLGLTTGAYGTLSSVSTIVLAVATLGAPILAERAGSVRGPIIAQMLSVPLILGLALFTNIPVVIALFLLRGTLMNVGQPALQSYVMGILAPGERSAASSVFNIGFQVTIAIGGVLSGIIIAHGGYRLAFLLAAPCYFGAMLLLVPWFRPHAAPQPHAEPLPVESAAE
jgi:MFS family permease